MAAPLPSVTISPAALTGLVGEPVTATLTFDNVSPTLADIGYSPYVDLVLPSAGADGDDGVVFGSASYQGSPVSVTTIDCPDGGGTVVHPLTDADVACADGTQLAVLQIPFGSFAPDQPAAGVVVSLNTSPLADIGVPLDITATPGFAFGDSATGTTPIVGEATSTTYTPLPVEFHKQYTGPENETATGPNYTRTYRLVVNVPDGQTAQDVIVSDLLPPTLAFAGISSITPATGVVQAEPDVGVPSNAPDNTVRVRFPSVTGTSSEEDAVVEIQVFVPELDADGNPVIDPGTGAPVSIRDDGAVAGVIRPADPRDPIQPFQVDPEDTSIDDHVLTARAAAVQKTAKPLAADGDINPGDAVQYKLRTQISDFATFDTFVLDDLLGDGLEFQPNSATFTVVEHGVTTTGALTAIDVDTSDHTCGGGTTSLAMDIRQALLDAGAADGTLEGGRVGGSFAATTITVTYNATILDAFRCKPDRPQLVPGDVVTNHVSANGQLPSGGSPSDDSSADLTVQVPTISKTVYARNGEVIPEGAPTPVFSAGDKITFRFTFPLGSSDMQSLSFTDFLPLPVLPIQGTPTYIPTRCGIPATGSICLGPGNSLPVPLNPTFTADFSSNSISADYGTFHVPDNPNNLVDVVFTATIADEPFRAELNLVNQLEARWTDTDLQEHVSTAVAPFTVTAPALRVTKGIVGTSNPAAVFEGGPRQPGGGITLGGPGTTCAASIAGGTLTTANLNGAPDADVSGVDSSDLVRFAVVVENTGKGVNGAFDVTLEDKLPAGFRIPDTGLNMCVTDGTGAPFSVASADGMFSAAPGTDGPLSGSLELADPGPTQSPGGALDPPASDLSSGRNLVVLSYELETTEDLPDLGEAVNTATITNYSAEDGGQNFTPVTPAASLTNDAKVTARLPQVDKAVVSTDQPFTSGSNVVVGESVNYDVTVTVPEGTLADVSVTDTLPAGLAMVSLDSIEVPSDAVTTDTPGGFNALLAAARGSLASPGHELNVDLGTLTNTDTDDTVAETIVLHYTAIVLDVAENQAGSVARNSVVLDYAGHKLPAKTAAVTVAEPAIQVAKSPSPAIADGGDTITYTVTVTNTAPSTVDAFNVNLNDVIPDTIDYVPGSLELVSGPDPTSISDANAPALSVSWDELALGESATLKYQATIPADVEAPQLVTNTAKADWTSLPSGTTPDSPFNADGRERTGAGGVDDYTVSADGKLQVGTGAIDKALNSTSEPSTTGQTLTIGEVATYDVRVRLSEGQRNDLVITDQIPSGMAYVADSAQVLTAAGSGTAPYALASDFSGVLPTPTITGGGSDGEDLVVSFPGETSVTADNNATNNAFVIRLKAVALDVPANVGVAPTPSSLTNVATVTAEGQGTATSKPVVSPIVEPRLAIVKTLNPVQGQQGDRVSSTIAVTNTGTSTAFDVLVEDLLPPEYVAGSVTADSTPAGFVFAQSGSDLSWQGGDIAAGQTVQFVISADLQDDLVAGTLVTNTATASQASTLPATADGERIEPSVTTSATLNVVDADLSISKDDQDVLVAPGDQQTYQIAVRNGGGAPATGAVITDVLAPSTTFVSVGGPGCSLVSQTGANVVIAIDGEIASGATVTCTLTVTIDNPLPAGVRVFTNSAAVAYDGDDDDLTPENNRAEDTDSLDPAVGPAIAVTKDDGIDVVKAGQAVTYDVVATNSGPIGASGVVVEDTLPPDTAFVACRAVPNVDCSFDPQTGKVSAVFPVLEGAGGTGTLEIDLVVNKPIDAGLDEIVNTVTVSDDGANGPDDPADNTATDTDQLNASPDLAISKTVNASDVSPGQTFGYRLRVANIGDQNATGVSVADTVPAGLTIDCASVQPAASSCDPATGELLWESPAIPDPLNRGDFLTFAYEVKVDNPTVAGRHAFDNTATVADDGANGADPTPQNNSSSAHVDLLVGPGGAQPDLSIVKDDSETDVSPGQQLDYTLTVTNSGNIGASGVVVSDTLPEGMTFVSCDSEPAVACSETNGVVTATFPELAGGGGVATVTITVTVDAEQAAGVETLTNVASVADDGANGPDPTPGNNTDDDVDNLIAAPDLSVVKDDGNQERRPGDQYVYTLTVKNGGSQGATGVVVADRLPKGLELVDCSPQCATVGNLLTWKVPSLDAGQQLGLLVTVRVAAAIPAGVEFVHNTVGVTDDHTNGSDPTPANNVDSDTDTVVAAPELQITKTDGKLAAVPGARNTYEITVTNIGDQDASGVSVVDQLPDTLTFVGCSEACDSTALPAVSWGLDELAAGATHTFTLEADVVDPLPAGVSLITNPVVVSHDSAREGVDDPADDIDTDTDIVNAAPGVHLTKDDGRARVEGGDTVTYDLTAVNTGDQDTTEVTIVDTLPAGMNFVSCSTEPAVSCDEADGVVTAVFPTLRGRGLEQARMQITVNVANPVAQGVTEFKNVATVDDADAGTEPNDTATDTDTYGADIAVTKDDGLSEVTPGQKVDYVVKVSNRGPSVVDQVVLADEVPGELTDVSFEPSSGTYNPKTGVWDGIKLEVGDSIDMHVKATVDPAARGTLANTVTVALPDGFTDPSPENNRATDTDKLAPKSAVTIEKSGPALAAPDSQVVYDIRVANEGPSDATGVRVEDTVPPGLEWVSSAGDGWTCTNGDNVICEFGPSLAPDDATTLSLTFKVEATSGTIVNVADVSTAEGSYGRDDAVTSVVPLAITGATGSKLLLFAILLLLGGLAFTRYSRNQYSRGVRPAR
ncbi:DUF11 domain-containing protein [Leucobacter viscericola]|uniref:DUF11 domain-containing protein n=1 Tax=Leucobacter viscericola TaxID=2714935 RepID=A0A6G7XFF2_9MICO|nr:isopeptide-forming domain-containing fimbrial protein [Leucobacter viscericola]QIK63340.1 DUF11 domain-containing protein [Leucobacter viscericola]